MSYPESLTEEEFCSFQTDSLFLLPFLTITDLIRWSGGNQPILDFCLSPTPFAVEIGKKSF